MRVAISISATRDNLDDFVTYVQEAERLGAAVCFVAEAWGTDAVSPLAYLAARTERILLGSGIMQISARAPVMTAQTALTLAMLSANRFILGLGVSGPQVVEGLHGVSRGRASCAMTRGSPSHGPSACCHSTRLGE
jgi:alkanesulfonate monooxygenase SsuD/methylene tetrahydromethanopterin reductase-like flavin-dependent oxidoreductase (luciferase family)